MEDQLKKQLEEGTQMAFSQYRERHPTLAGYLERHCSDIIASAIESIKDDPEVMAALQSAKAETRLQRIVETAAEYLPKIIGML